MSEIPHDAPQHGRSCDTSTIRRNEPIVHLSTGDTSNRRRVRTGSATPPRLTDADHAECSVRTESTSYKYILEMMGHVPT